MEKQEVKLLGSSISPFVRRIEWALKLKGIEYEYSEENLQNKSDLFLESNPVYKKVPVLIHGGKPICESLVILEYIDEIWPQNRLLPEDPYEKAIVRFWANYAEDKLMQGIRNVLMSEGEEQAKGVKQVTAALHIIDAEMKSITKFFGGETIGYLDIVLGLTVLWLEVVDEVSSESKMFDLQSFPSYSKWMEAVKDLPLIKDNLPAKDILYREEQITLTVVPSIDNTKVE
ncbi:hypothetical protein IFM89_014050 [Coptis chinensis]|uniref:glutathione transferase n=1 Tax=Coptis chinensis TaxID=261450 RepID=A0A835I276_9MAGN|nr:hypothetical protein IFM89_014050 [Coptis chinensis]